MLRCPMADIPEPDGPKVPGLPDLDAGDKAEEAGPDPADPLGDRLVAALFLLALWLGGPMGDGCCC